MDLSPLGPHPIALVLAVAFDFVLGDPVYRWHPVRLMGSTLSAFEQRLRGLGLDGYGGGILLFVLLAALWLAVWCAAIVGAFTLLPQAGWVLHVFVLYSLLALRDLLTHAKRVQHAAEWEDLSATRHAIAQLVGRDTSKMDIPACRRAAIESLSENLTDGFVSPIFWYALGGIPGLVLFKVVSTMDSMVGYKTLRYLRFGWCGARLDDLMNLIPARFTWLLLAVLAAFLPRYSGTKALRVGWQQHAVVPGPNAGWSEAAMAGAIQRKLIGPIWADGRLVTELWLGDPDDAPAGDPDDLRRASNLTVLAGVVIVALAAWLLLHWRGMV